MYTLPYTQDKISLKIKIKYIIFDYMYRVFKNGLYKFFRDLQIYQCSCAIQYVGTYICNCDVLTHGPCINYMYFALPPTHMYLLRTYIYISSSERFIFMYCVYYIGFSCKYIYNNFTVLSRLCLPYKYGCFIK